MWAITYDDSEYELDNVISRIKRKIPRPVSGFHIGVSGQSGAAIEGGGYYQIDFIMDWQEGTIYVMETVGAFGYLGTPTLLEGEAYFGSSNFYGIPNNEQDIGDFLAGENADFAISVAGDVIGRVGASKGLSVDLDKDGKPVYTDEAGYMYAVENSFELGINDVPNALDVGVEAGVSHSWVQWQISLPIWFGRK